jgi:hypothetical protein
MGIWMLHLMKRSCIMNGNRKNPYRS